MRKIDSVHQSDKVGTFEIRGTLNVELLFQLQWVGSNGVE